jgi:sugar-specific transcriptional regulator TrmB
MSIERLKQFNLTAGEAELYLFLLENGDSPVSEIAAQTNIGRTNIYDYAKSLIEKGLASDYERSKKIYYKAESPAQLEKQVETKVREAQNLHAQYQELLPMLQELYVRNSDLMQVKYLLGDEGYKKMCGRIYMEGSSDKLIMLLKDLNLYEPPDPKYRSFIQNRQLYTYIFSNQKQIVAEFNSRDTRNLRETRYLDISMKEDVVVHESTLFIGKFSSRDFKMAVVENCGLAQLLTHLLVK